MADLLIEDVPDDVLAVLHAHATACGVPLGDHVRGRLQLELRTDRRVTTEDPTSMTEAFADSREPEVMKGAWH